MSTDADRAAADDGERKPIQLVGRRWTVRAQEHRSLADYEHVESELVLEGDVPVDVGELSLERRKELKRELAQIHADLQSVLAGEMERKLSGDGDD